MEEEASTCNDRADDDDYGREREIDKELHNTRARLFSCRKKKTRKRMALFFLSSPLQSSGTNV